MLLLQTNMPTAKEREDKVLDSLAASIEGMGTDQAADGFQPAKKSKKKKRRNKQRPAGGGGGGGGADIDDAEDEDDADEDADDPLLRLAAMQKAAASSTTRPLTTASSTGGGASAARKPPPVPAHILGSLKAAESMNAGGDGGNGARPRRTKAEERLASAQLEHDSLVRMFDSTAPADADDQLQRTLHLSEVVAKLDAAKAQVEEEAKRTKEKALPSGEDLLLLTRTNIFARQHSDEATIASVDGESTGAGTPLAGGTKPKFEFPDPRTVRSFAVQDATAAAKARKAAAEAAVEGGFVALGMEDSMLPPELLEGHRGMFVVSARRRCH
jgi:hypothetical protein